MRTLLTIFVGSVLLFVVVCPITPTPIAVLDGKGHAVQAPVLLASIVPLALPRLDGIMSDVLSEGPVLVLTGKLLDLTCTWRC